MQPMTNYAMIRVNAKDVKAGQTLINIGKVSEVQVFEELTRIIIRESICKSCAFYWFMSLAVLTVEN
jgi:NRPS condensation-like uncharacterized protein